MLARAATPPAQVVGSDDEDSGDELGATQHLAASSGKGGSQRPVREAIYDVDAMHEKLEDIGWADHVHWEETLALTHEEPYEVGRGLQYSVPQPDNLQHAFRGVGAQGGNKACCNMGR